MICITKEKHQRSGYFSTLAFLTTSLSNRHNEVIPLINKLSPVKFAIISVEICVYYKAYAAILSSQLKLLPLLRKFIFAED